MDLEAAKTVTLKYIIWQIVANNYNIPRPSQGIYDVPVLMFKTTRVQEIYHTNQ